MQNRFALFQIVPLSTYSLGTNTGMALNYVTRTLLRRGNRRQARDVVLLITDGESNDRVLIPALQLRRTGALVGVRANFPVISDIQYTALA